jgi:Ca2+-binding RTX toxin-like protein
LGYDPVGLNNNLPIANGSIAATLLRGDYVATHTYGWSEFDIDPLSQALTVTTYGIAPYSESQLPADPTEIGARVPSIVSQFTVTPRGFSAINGTENGETFLGTAGSDRLNGLGGNDTIAGEGGNDLVFGGDGDDLLRGDANIRDPGGRIGGDDTIYGGSGNDRIGGKGGNDRLFGDEGNDQIWGDDGDDLLRGGLGNDTLTGDDFSGGRGSDTFVLAPEEGTDTIVDFRVGIDRIGLANGLTFGQLFLSGDRILVNRGDGTLETLASLSGINTATLTEASFISVI